MEKYAIIKVGNRQYTVKENEVFNVERQVKPVKVDVLFYSDGTKNLVGEPVLKDVVVKVTVVSEKRERKIRVGRFKSKSRYRKVKGHKQSLTELRVEKISLAGEKEVEKEVTKEEKPVKEAKAVAKAVKTAAKAPKTAKKVVAKTSKETSNKTVKTSKKVTK